MLSSSTPSIRGPLEGLRRAQGRPVAKAAPFTLDLLPQLLATCDVSARGRGDGTLLLFGFAGTLRRSELVALRVEDVVEVAGGLKLRILRGKTDQVGQGAEIGLPRGRHVETCPLLAFHAWRAVAKRKAGLLFRRISTGDGIRDAALHPDAVPPWLYHHLTISGPAEAVASFGEAARGAGIIPWRQGPGRRPPWSATAAPARSTSTGSCRSRPPPWSWARTRADRTDLLALEQLFFRARHCRRELP